MATSKTMHEKAEIFTAHSFPSNSLDLHQSLSGTRSSKSGVDMSTPVHSVETTPAKLYSTSV